MTFVKFIWFIYILLGGARYRSVGVVNSRVTLNIYESGMYRIGLDCLRTNRKKSNTEKKDGKHR